PGSQGGEDGPDARDLGRGQARGVQGGLDQGDQLPAQAAAGLGGAFLQPRAGQPAGQLLDGADGIGAAVACLQRPLQAPARLGRRRDGGTASSSWTWRSVSALVAPLNGGWPVSSS